MSPEKETLEYTEPTQERASDPAPDGGCVKPSEPAEEKRRGRQRNSRFRSFWDNAEKKTLVFIVLAVTALLLYLIVNFPAVTSLLSTVFDILKPLLIGAVIAYLCNPILKLYEYRVFRKMKKDGIRRGLSMFLTILTALLIVALVVLMIVPQLLSSFQDLTNNWESYVNTLLSSVQIVLNKITANLPIDVDISSTDRVTELIENTYGSLEDFYVEAIKPKIEGFLNIDTVFNSAMAMFSFLTDTILSCFVAGYILGSKEKRKAQIAKFRRAMFSSETDTRITNVVKLVDKSFGGFLYGSIIDSVLVAIVTYIFMAIFRISPYNLLIATFVGITNIIPFFGPFIGAIPSFFIVLISNPTKAFWFLVLILIIQQIDGNIIVPKILGENTGISSLSVLIAITIGGALWGVVGMLIGVPIFAVIIELIKQNVENRLAARGEPTDTMDYYDKDALGNAERDVYYEHSTLRYKYEHSNIKPKIDKIIMKFKRQSKDLTSPNQPDSIPDMPDWGDEIPDMPDWGDDVLDNTAPADEGADASARSAGASDMPDRRDDA